MTMKVKKQGNRCKVTFEGELSIYEAAEVYEKFRKYMSTCDSFDIDLQYVTEIDTSGVQILLAVKREAFKLGKDVSMTMHSEPVVEVFELLNIAHEFGDPIVLSNRETA
jgi:anti-sigma B factor antagonist